MAAKARDKSLVHLLMEPAFIERIDDFRFANRFPSRNDAIRFLIEKGLELAGRPDLAKPARPSSRRRTDPHPDP